MNRLNRRDLLRTAAVAGAALAAPVSLVESRQERSGRRLLKPKKLQPGDTVGMVLPASLEFQNVAGVVFGYCTNCPAERSSFSLEQVLRHHLEPLGVPVFAGLAFGHLEQKLTLPIGIEAAMDAEAGTITIDEAAVV